MHLTRAYLSVSAQCFGVCAVHSGLLVLSGHQWYAPGRVQGQFLSRSQWQN